MPPCVVRRTPSAAGAIALELRVVLGVTLPSIFIQSMPLVMNHYKPPRNRAVPQTDFFSAQQSNQRFNVRRMSTAVLGSTGGVITSTKVDIG